MTTRKKSKKVARLTRSDEYKKEALKLADTVGVTEAARQLQIHTTQIYNWRNKLRVKESRSESEKRLLEENARLTRELAEKKQENDLVPVKKLGSGIVADLRVGTPSGDPD
jgi:transposase